MIQFCKDSDTLSQLSKVQFIWGDYTQKTISNKWTHDMIFQKPEDGYTLNSASSHIRLMIRAITWAKLLKDKIMSFSNSICMKATAEEHKKWCRGEKINSIVPESS